MNIYTIAGSISGTQTINTRNLTQSIINNPRSVSIDILGNIYILSQNSVYKLYSYKPILYSTTTNTYFGKSMTENNIYIGLQDQDQLN